jgi:hypothetical protein
VVEGKLLPQSVGQGFGIHNQTVGDSLIGRGEHEAVQDLTALPLSWRSGIP